MDIGIDLNKAIRLNNIQELVKKTIQYDLLSDYKLDQINHVSESAIILNEINKYYTLYFYNQKNELVYKFYYTFDIVKETYILHDYDSHLAYREYKNGSMIDGESWKYGKFIRKSKRLKPNNINSSSSSSGNTIIKKSKKE